MGGVAMSPYRPKVMTTVDRAGIDATGRYPANPPAAVTTGGVTGPSPSTGSTVGAPHSGPAASESFGDTGVVATFVRTRAVSSGLVRSAAMTDGASLATAVHVPLESAGWAARRATSRR